MNFVPQNNQNNYMNSEQALDINMSSMQPQPANTANYSYHHQHHQQHHQQKSNSNSFGPSRVLNLQVIQQSLGLNTPLTELDVLTLARQAILNGFIENNKIFISNICCHRIVYNQMTFVLTEGFDAVVTINWNNQPQQLIGDHINKSTFQQINTNQFNQSHVPSHTFVNNNSPPLRQSVIQPQPQQNKNISIPIPPVPKPNKLIDTTSVDSLGDEECMSEYDGIINEIIDCVNLDVDADPELTDFHDNEKLPPLPPQLTINTNTTYNSCGNNAAFASDYDSPIPTTTNQHLALPRVDRLKTQSSFYSINDDNQSVEQLQTQRPQLKYVHSQNNVLFGAAESTSSGDYNHYGIEVTISNALWNELYHRPGFYGQPGFSSKQELIGMITQCIHQNRAPQSTIGDRREFCVWVDRHYVYITDIDMSTLIDVFEFGFFNNQNGQVLKQLNQRKYNIPSSAMKHPSNINQYIHNNINNNNNRKLVKNASGRSILSNASSTNNKNNNNNNNNNKDVNKKHEYHTIYLKPIIERMKAITYKLEGSSSTYSSIDSDYIINIVDKSIKFGTKRQISKRTFEFKWQSYTIIMSKSLKTILDVTLSNDLEIITVHPDVVSIISKKCPQLDYFTIQKVAKQAKLKAAFTTKKNDYRQQFIYDYCGCRIVFASNHTTIVEMQCNDTSAINKAIRSQ